MAGFDDPRYLQQVIQKLQADVAHLKKSTLPLASQQRGPIPGSMRAVQINDANQKSAMWLSFAGNQPGLAPYQAVTDPNGTVRYEAGNLAAKGVSAAHYGWRVNDANAVPIADAIGLSQVMSQLGHVDNQTASSYTTTTPTLVSAGGTNASVTFSLVRQARVLALNSIIGFSSQAVGIVDLFVDGTDIALGIWPDIAFGAASPTMTGVAYYSDSLAAGSHTLQLRGYVQTTPGTLTVATFDLIVWLLGT